MLIVKKILYSISIDTLRYIFKILNIGLHSSSPSNIMICVDISCEGRDSIDLSRYTCTLGCVYMLPKPLVNILVYGRYSIAWTIVLITTSNVTHMLRCSSTNVSNYFSKLKITTILYPLCLDVNVILDDETATWGY